MGPLREGPGVAGRIRLTLAAKAGNTAVVRVEKSVTAKRRRNSLNEEGFPYGAVKCAAKSARIFHRIRKLNAVCLNFLPEQTSCATLETSDSYGP